MTVEQGKIAKEAIGRWARFEDGAIVSVGGPDDCSKPMGEQSVDLEDVKAWNTVNEALWILERAVGVAKCCTLREMLHNVHVKGIPPRKFYCEGINVPSFPKELRMLGWSADLLLDFTYVRVLQAVCEVLETKQKTLAE